MQRLVLGTAQWGAGYGITNAVGRLDDDAIAEIMTVAEQAGIDAVDTAAGYGDAQERLQPWAAGLEVTTKVSGAAPDRIAELAEEAARTLGRDSVDALLLHDWDELDKSQHRAAAERLTAVRAAGLASRVGTSVYEDRGIRASIRALPDLGAIQVPANALDRRLDGSTMLRHLHDRGTRIQVRSVFLQGLLAGPSSSPLGEHPAVVAFHRAAAEAGRSAAAFALAHVRALPWADEIVVGVTSAAELDVIVAAWNDAEPASAPIELATDDLSLIDPRRWGA